MQHIAGQHLKPIRKGGAVLLSGCCFLLQRIRELPADYSKNLNLSPSYVSAYPANIRELLQNHADHCRYPASNSSSQTTNVAQMLVTVILQHAENSYTGTSTVVCV